MEIRPILHSELALLREISISTFVNAFGHLNEPHDMKLYLEESRNVERVQEEFEDPNVMLFFVEEGDVIIGYMKVNMGSSQTEIFGLKTMELERIYLLEGHQSKGYGDNMMKFFEALGKAHKMEKIWLGVWKENPRAISFYQSHGFEIFGEHDYLLGTDLQRDYLLGKML